jgi:hypothetical protein
MTKFSGSVMPGLVLGIHAFEWCRCGAWMAGSSPAMTMEEGTEA